MGKNRSTTSVLRGLLIVSVLLGSLSSSYVSAVQKRVFLMRQEGVYRVVWVNGASEIHSRDFATLHEALNHIQTRGLRLARRDRFSPIQRVWVGTDDNQHRLYWKFNSLKDTFQFTLASHNEAEFFRKAFLQGAYSPSPFGHSLLFE